jgi:hypothetical protein
MFSTPLNARIRHARRIRSIRQHQFAQLRSLGPVARDGIIAIIVARDEILRLPDCLRHHRELGVDRFVVIDNGSSDGTTDYLCDQPDVDVIRTEDPYSKAHRGMSWRHYVVSRCGFGRWYLLIDADELLVYDGMDEHNLKRLTEILKRRRIPLLHATMIDMYPRGPTRNPGFQSGDSMLSAAAYFDGDSYFLDERLREKLRMRGGPRVRLLSTDEKPFEINLSKYPLVFWHRGVNARSIHEFVTTLNRPLPSGALLHFKFLDDFDLRVDKALKEGQHWNGSEQYQIYKDANLTPSNMFYDGSRRYEGPDSLLSMKLLTSMAYER